MMAGRKSKKSGNLSNRVVLPGLILKAVKFEYWLVSEKHFYLVGEIEKVVW